MGVGLKKEHISEWVKLMNGLLALIMKALNCMSHDELLKHVQEYRKYHPKDTEFDKKLLRHFDVENKNIYEFAMGKKCSLRKKNLPATSSCCGKVKPEEAYFFTREMLINLVIMIFAPGFLLSFVVFFQYEK